MQTKYEFPYFEIPELNIFGPYFWLLRNICQKTFIKNMYYNTHLKKTHSFNAYWKMKALLCFISTHLFLQKIRLSCVEFPYFEVAEFLVTLYSDGFSFAAQSLEYSFGHQCFLDIVTTVDHASLSPICLTCCTSVKTGGLTTDSHLIIVASSCQSRPSYFSTI